MSPNTRLMLDMSTANLDEESVQYLQSQQETSRIVWYDKAEYGWFVHVNADELEAVKPEIPAQLHRCMHYAAKAGYQWIMFDCDGTEHDLDKPLERMDNTLTLDSIKVDGTDSGIRLKAMIGTSGAGQYQYMVVTAHRGDKQIADVCFTLEHERKHLSVLISTTDKVDQDFDIEVQPERCADKAVVMLQGAWTSPRATENGPVKLAYSLRTASGRVGTGFIGTDKPLIWDREWDGESEDHTVQAILVAFDAAGNLSDTIKVNNQQWSDFDAKGDEKTLLDLVKKSTDLERAFLIASIAPGETF